MIRTFYYWLIIWDHGRVADGRRKLGIFAKSEILANEQLTIDYKWEVEEGEAVTSCKCRSKKCKGTIEMVSDLFYVAFLNDLYIYKGFKNEKEKKRR